MSKYQKFEMGLRGASPTSSLQISQNCFRQLKWIWLYQSHLVSLHISSLSTSLSSSPLTPHPTGCGYISGYVIIRQDTVTWILCHVYISLLILVDDGTHFSLRLNPHLHYWDNQINQYWITPWLSNKTNTGTIFRVFSKTFNFWRVSQKPLTCDRWCRTVQPHVW